MGSLLDQVQLLIRPITEDLQIELFDLQWITKNNQEILQVVIDKEGGVTLDDCTEVSRKISFLFDVEDIIPFEYVLEVSSPGVFRELKRTEDFQQYINHRVKAFFKTVVDGKQVLVGTLVSVSKDQLTLVSGVNSFKINQSDLKKIHLFPEL